MRVEVGAGFSTHSGWAVAVTAGLDGDDHLRVVDRRRVELIDPGLPQQAYHAAETLPPDRAEALVALVDDSIAARAQTVLGEIVAATGGSSVVAVAVVGEPREIPDVATVLASHARMHACEGEQYRRGITKAAADLDIPALRIASAALSGHLAAALGWTSERIVDELAAVRAVVGPPWQRDHKDAALAAVTALRM